METDHQRSAQARTSRRAVLQAGVVAAVSPYAVSAEARSTVITGLNIIRLRKIGQRRPVGEPYVEVTTNRKVSGFGGPLYREQAKSLEQLAPQLRKLLQGKTAARELSFEWLWGQLYPDKPLAAYAKGIDPLTGKAVWNTRRKARHTPTGNIITAMSAVDNALWDIRGKLANQPVCRLLADRTRARLRAYISMVPGDDLAKARKRARALFDEGHTAQKWFFRWGPPDGKAGFAKVVGLVEGLRDELGEKARLMFDFHVGSRGRCDWDAAYAIRVAEAIRPFKPAWLEEPFSPEEIDSYRRLKGETDIPLAAGEHAYSRWHIKPFLDAKLLAVVQADPEWCGGLSELVQICALASQYENVRVVPHGHHVLAAAHVVASQPEALCPMVEHGPAWLRHRQQAQTRSIAPKAGYLSTPTEPGLGPTIDWDRFERA